LRGDLVKRVLSKAALDSEGNAGTGVAPKKVDVLGCRVDPLGMSETVERCIELMDRGSRPVRQVSVNAAKVVQCAEDHGLAETVAKADIASADGQAVVWAARLLGRPLPGRVAGIDLMGELLSLAEHRGLSVYFLGAKQHVLERAVAEIRKKHPRLRVAGARNGYFDPAEDEHVALEIREVAPDMLFVAMTSPRKELWVDRYAEIAGARFAMGVGGSLDVLAGERTRAPVWMQRIGLEWLFRMSQDPGRMWRRYFVGNARFAWLLGKAIAERLMRRAY
jgi:N-acetylglucosaminyldiphosphoundecaprenol N-acetyl-beta-D-mannosaminyltransferase